MRPDLKQQLENIKPIKAPLGLKWRLFFRLIGKMIGGGDWGHFSWGLKPIYTLASFSIVVGGAYFYVTNQIVSVSTPFSEKSAVTPALIEKNSVDFSEMHRAGLETEKSVTIAAQVSDYLDKAETARDKLLAKIEQDPTLISALTEEQLRLLY